MRYVKAKYDLYIKELSYRIYITDSVYLLADGKRLNYRFAEKLYPEPVDDRTGDEIALEVITNLGLKV